MPALSANQIAFSRCWSMPSAWTFSMRPVGALLSRCIGTSGRGWVDPFAGHFSPAEFTNDMNPSRNARWHMEALEFCQRLPRLTGHVSFEGVLFDPPYSNRQISEHYRGLGTSARALDTSARFYSAVKAAIAPVIRDGGLAISFGWNSVGFGKKHGFQIIEVMLVSHGGAKNDTIVTVERKTVSAGRAS